jgi:hypothetical protein
MRALHRAGAKLAIDFSNDTMSLWVPDTWMHRLSVSVRRTLSLGRRLPFTWRD